ncbi:MAG: 4Fe-4S dicluster domain-containing protein [Desulfobacteraceae bacterium]|nr:4Fe-4S dicluster domain-containing protein [Desulfobacteraceae bacterium]
MDSQRRKFLKMAGLTAVAGMGAPAINMLLKGEVRASETEASTAPALPTKSVKRLGMVVDVNKFGANPGLAQKCVEACHSIHNVPDFRNPDGSIDKKDEVKWIWAEKYEHTFPDASQYKRNVGLEELPVMTFCNHCDDPPCVRACPTQATFKAKDSGIVMMDYHRCIGCRFCMAACPYGARSFNWRDPRPFIKKLNPDFPTRMRGVVEKCTFCAERLAVGKIPACVEATGDTKAMVFGDLNDPNSEISKILASTFTIQRKPFLGTKPSVFYII